MAGKSPVTAGAEEQLALEALAASRDRGEADRARAVLLTLAGWTSARIGEAFGVREDTVRLWRSDYAGGAGGAGGGPAELDHCPTARGDRGQRGGADQPFAVVQGAAQKKVALFGFRG